MNSRATTCVNKMICVARFENSVQVDMLVSVKVTKISQLYSLLYCAFYTVYFTKSLC